MPVKYARTKRTLRKNFEKMELETLNDLVYPRTRAIVEKHGGLERIVKLLKEVGKYDDVRIEEGYKSKLEALGKTLSALPHDAFVIVGRSALDHAHVRTPLWEKVLTKHASRGTLFWLNTKRESEISWDNPVDPNSKSMHGALKQLAMELAELARTKRKKRLQVVVFDDAIRTGRTIVNLAQTLRRYALLNGVNVEVIPAAVVFNPVTFMYQHSLLRDSDIRKMFNKDLAKLFWKAVVYKAVFPKAAGSILRQLEKEGIEKSKVNDVLRALEKWRILPPIAAHMTTAVHLNPLSHEISDVTETLLEKDELTPKEREAIEVFSEILGERANELSSYREYVKRSAKMLTRTRPQ